MQTMKKALAIILAVALVFTSVNLPVGAYAQAPEGEINSVETLQAALEKGGDIKLTGDIVAQRTEFTVGQGITVSLDLNGHTLSGAGEGNASSALITNNGTLTIKDSAGDAGKITYSYSVPEKGTVPSKGNYTINNNGILTVENGTVENTTNVENAFAVYALNNNSGATATINGGTIQSHDYAIRMYAADSSKENKLIVNNGTIGGFDKYGIWMQGVANDENDAPKADLQINGGTFLYTRTSLWNGKGSQKKLKTTITDGTFKGNFVISDKTGAQENITVKDNQTVSVTGGDFFWLYEKIEANDTPSKFIKGGSFKYIARNDRAEDANVVQECMIVNDTSKCRVVKKINSIIWEPSENTLTYSQDLKFPTATFTDEQSHHLTVKAEPIDDAVPSVPGENAESTEKVAVDAAPTPERAWPAVGKYKLTASLSENDALKYGIPEAVENTKEVEITANKLTLYREEQNLTVVNGQELTKEQLSAGITGNEKNAITFSIDPNNTVDGATIEENALKTTAGNTGTVGIIAKVEVDSNNDGVPEITSNEINFNVVIKDKEQATIEIKSAVNAVDGVVPVVYDGEPVTVAAASAEANDFTYTYTVSTGASVNAAEWYSVDESNIEKKLETAPTNVGKYILKLSANETATHTSANAEIRFDIVPKTIKATKATLTARDYEANKLDVVVSEVTFDDTLTASDYTATATIPNANAGKRTDATVTVTLKEGGNYVFANNALTSTLEGQSVEINKIANTTATKTFRKEFKQTTEGITIDFTSLFKGIDGATIKSAAEKSGSGHACVTGESHTANSVTFTTAKEIGTAVWNVTVQSTNYNDYDIEVTLVSSEGEPQKAITVDAKDLTETYGKNVVLNVLGGSVPDGNVTYTLTSNESVVQDDNNAQATGRVITLKTLKAGTFDIEITLAGGKVGEVDYAPTKVKYTVTVEKADVKGEPTYKFTEPTEGKAKLSDYALENGSLDPAAGTLKWTLDGATEIKEDVAYEWTFIPTETEKYNTKTGTFVLKKKPAPTPVIPAPTPTPEPKPEPKPEPVVKLDVVKPEAPVVPESGAEIGMDKNQQQAADKVVGDIVNDIVKPEPPVEPEKPQTEAEKETAKTEAAIVEAVKNDEKINVKVESKKVDEAKAPVEVKAEIKQIKETVTASLGEMGTKILQFVNIEVKAEAVSKDGKTRDLGNLRNVSQKIEFTFQLPAATKGTNFGVVRIHDGKVEFLPMSDVKFDEATKQITFKTDRFSTYAVYEFDPNAPELKLVSIDKIEEQVFEGAKVEPTIVVRNSKGDTVESTAYTVTYDKNNAPGVATVKIVGVAPYQGEVIAEFTIKEKVVEPVEPEKPAKPGIVKNVKVDTDNGLLKVKFNKVNGADSYRVYVRQDGKAWRWYKGNSKGTMIKKIYKKALVKNGKYQVKVVAMNGEVKGKDSNIVKVYANRLGKKSSVMPQTKINRIKSYKGKITVYARDVKFNSNPKKVAYQVSYKLKGTNKWIKTGYTFGNVKTVKGLKVGKTYNIALRYRYKSALDGKTFVYSKPVYQTKTVW